MKHIIKYTIPEIKTKDYIVYKNIIIFKPKFNKYIHDFYPLILSNNISHLIFGDFNNLDWNIEVYVDMSKKSCQHRRYSKINRFGIPIVYLPNQIERIRFGHYFNQSIELLFQVNTQIKFLEFGSSFKKTIDCLSSTQLIKLILGCWFNSKVNNLPSTLEYLEFGELFNQNVDNLPNGLKYIIFGHKFNMNVDKLPSTIIKIVFGKCFNKSIDDLPNSVHKIYFPKSKSDFTQSLDNLVDSVKILELSPCYKLPINILPNNLEKIICSPKCIK